MLENVLSNWQAFNSAMIALTASVLAIYTTIYRDKKQCEREYICALAHLPLTLSSLIEYNENCAQVILRYYKDCKRNKHSKQRPFKEQTDELEPINIDKLAQCIKFASTADADHYKKIIEMIQVQNSRTKKLTVGISNVSYAMGLFDESLKLHVYLSNTFNHARNHFEAIESYRCEQKKTALLNCDIHLDTVPELHDYIQQGSATFKKIPSWKKLLTRAKLSILSYKKR